MIFKGMHPQENGIMANTSHKIDDDGGYDSPYALIQSRLLNREFTGTHVELRKEIKSILDGRHVGDMDALVDVVLCTFAKELHVREALRRADVDADTAVTAFQLCTRSLSLDKMTITDLSGFSNCFESADRSGGVCNTKPSAMTNDAVSLETVSQRLIDAFVAHRAIDVKLRAAIDYVVNVGYATIDADRQQLIGCLEEELIDGLPLQDTLSSCSGLHRVVATAYSQRCQKVFDFLSKNLRPFFERFVGGTPKRSGKFPPAVGEVLDSDDVRAIKAFFGELGDMHCGLPKEMAVSVLERCLEKKLASVPWQKHRQAIVQWLHLNKLVDSV